MLCVNSAQFLFHANTSNILVISPNVYKMDEYVSYIFTCSLSLSLSLPFCCVTKYTHDPLKSENQFCSVDPKGHRRKEGTEGEK